ncbi:survival factor 1 [Lyophyllum atratum]|nr:survival factor 1 [Lyophyllum atratum]
MFSSIFSTSAPVDPTAPNLHPVSERFKHDELFGKLEPKDTEWLCAGGFATETQTFYVSADDGSILMCQVIHSAVGLWYPTIQFVFKYHNLKTKETIWKSVNVTNFVTPPPGLDKRSCKADEFSITYKHTPDSDHPEIYTIRANLAVDLQLSFEIARPAAIPGWKVGNGPKGGYTYFGPVPEKAEGFAIHRFWPHVKATGHVIHNGKASTYQGPGIMVHAIQGMRPNLLAASWNFANFQSEQHGGVSAIQMEFKTCDSHGRKGAGSGGVWVNVGSLVVGGKLLSVTADTKYPGEEPLDTGVISRTTHLNAVLDPDTSYQQPRQILFKWQGPSIIADAPGPVKAQLEVDVGDNENPKGLIEKVDVLAEIPYVVRMAVNYVAGTKPYIYQWLNPATLSISGPESVLPGLSEGLEVSGSLFNEASYIS